MKHNFKELFESSKTKPSRIKYKNNTIFTIDKFPVKNKDVLELSIEKTHHKFPQGLAVGIYGRGKVAFETVRGGKYIEMLFWEDSQILDPTCIEIQVFTKEDFVLIRNIWEQYTLEGEKKACYVGSSEWRRDRGNGAAMYSEEIEGGRRYFCNDGEEDDDFDDIIFTVKNLGPPDKPLRLIKPKSKK